MSDRLELVKIVGLFLMLWIAIDLWGKVYGNFTRNELGLNPFSTKDSLFSAGLWTMILFLIFFQSPTLRSYGELITSGTQISHY